MENTQNNAKKRKKAHKQTVYNVIISLLILALLVVIAFIVRKNYISYQNEEEIKEVLNTIKHEESLEGKTYEYKGYEVVGVIKIPKIDLEYPILGVTTQQSMKYSVTKFWGTEITELGNYTIAGHNNHNGTMFGKVKYLENGDEIEVSDMKGNTVVYQVVGHYTTDPDDVSCIESIHPEKRELTLITCTNGNKNRLITRAEEKE